MIRSSHATVLPMKRWLLLGTALAVALLAFVFSLINFTSVTLDVYIGMVTLPLGVLVLLVLLAGAASAGLLLWALVILPQRFRIKALEKQLALAPSSGGYPGAIGASGPRV